MTTFRSARLTRLAFLALAMLPACTHGAPPSTSDASARAAAPDLSVALFTSYAPPREGAAAVWWGSEADRTRDREQEGCVRREEASCWVESCPPLRSETSEVARVRPGAGIGPIVVRDSLGRTRAELTPGADGDYPPWRGGRAWGDGESVSVTALGVEVGVTFPRTRLLVDRSSGPIVLRRGEDLPLAWDTEDAGAIEVVVRGSSDDGWVGCRFDAGQHRARVPRGLLASLASRADAKPRPYVFMQHTASSAKRVQGRELRVEAHEAVLLADLDVR